MGNVIDYKDIIIKKLRYIINEVLPEDKFAKIKKQCEKLESWKLQDTYENLEKLNEELSKLIKEEGTK